MGNEASSSHSLRERPAASILSDDEKRLVLRRRRVLAERRAQEERELEEEQQRDYKSFTALSLWPPAGVRGELKIPIKQKRRQNNNHNSRATARRGRGRVARGRKDSRYEEMLTRAESAGSVEDQRLREKRYYDHVDKNSDDDDDRETPIDDQLFPLDEIMALSEQVDRDVQIGDDDDDFDDEIEVYQLSKDRKELLDASDMVRRSGPQNTALDDVLFSDDRVLIATLHDRQYAIVLADAGDSLQRGDRELVVALREVVTRVLGREPLPSMVHRGTAQRDDRETQFLSDELARIRQQAEQESKRLNDELAHVRQQAEQESKRLNDELAHVRQQAEQESKRLNDELAHVRQRAEQESKRLSDELVHVREEVELRSVGDDEQLQLAHEIAQKHDVAREQAEQEAQRLKAELDAACREVEEESKRLNAELDAARQESDHLDKELHDSQHHVEEESKRLNAELDAARQESDRLDKELHDSQHHVEEESKRLNAELDAARQESDHLDKELHDSQHHVEEESKRLNAELDAARQESDRLDKELHDSQHHAEVLRKELQAARDALQAAELATTLGRAESVELQAKHADSIAEKAELEQALSDDRAQRAAEVDVTEERYRRTVAELEETCDADVERLEHERDELAAHLEASAATVTSLRAAVDSSHKHATQLADGVDATQAELAALRTRAAEQDAALADVQRALDEERKRAAEQADALSAELEVARSRAEALEMSQAGIEEELVTLRAEHVELARLQALLDAGAAEIDRLGAALTDKSDALDELRAQFAEQADELARLRALYEALLAERETEKEEAAKKRVAKRSIQENLSAFNTALAAGERANAALVDEERELGSRLAALKQGWPKRKQDAAAAGERGQAAAAEMRREARSWRELAKQVGQLDRVHAKLEQLKATLVERRRLAVEWLGLLEASRATMAADMESVDSLGSMVGQSDSDDVQSALGGLKKRLASLDADIGAVRALMERRTEEGDSIESYEPMRADFASRLDSLQRHNASVEAELRAQAAADDGDIEGDDESAPRQRALRALDAEQAELERLIDSVFDELSEQLKAATALHKGGAAANELLRAKRELKRAMATFKQVNARKAADADSVDDDERVAAKRQVTAKLEQLKQALAGTADARAPVEQHLAELEARIGELEAQLDQHSALTDRRQDVVAAMRGIVDDARANRQRGESAEAQLRRQLRRFKRIVDAERALLDELDRLRDRVDSDGERATYEAAAGDAIDGMISEYLNSLAADGDDALIIPPNFHRIEEGVYQFGTRKIHATVLSAGLMIRIGGGYISFDEFVRKFGRIESIKIIPAAAGGAPRTSTLIANRGTFKVVPTHANAGESSSSTAPKRSPRRRPVSTTLTRPSPVAGSHRRLVRASSSATMSVMSSSKPSGSAVQKSLSRSISTNMLLPKPAPASASSSSTTSPSTSPSRRRSSISRSRSSERLLSPR
jgi:chromosome segregation ATPase